MGSQKLLNQGWLDHSPVRKPRAGHIGEQVFAERWRELMASVPLHGEGHPNEMLETILRNYHKDQVDQRDATVAATVVCWLGCNCGRAILYIAKRLKELGAGPESYLYAWAGENRRSLGINRGYRTIEYMLAPDDHFGRQWPHESELSLVRRPEISVNDLEVAEHLFAWFRTGDGEAWIAESEREVDRRQAEAYRLGHDKWRAEAVCLGPLAE